MNMTDWRRHSKNLKNKDLQYNTPWSSTASPASVYGVRKILRPRAFASANDLSIPSESVKRVKVLGRRSDTWWNRGTMWMTVIDRHLAFWGFHSKLEQQRNGNTTKAFDNHYTTAYVSHCKVSDSYAYADIVVICTQRFARFRACTTSTCVHWRDMICYYVTMLHVLVSV